MHFTFGARQMIVEKVVRCCLESVDVADGRL